jgi:hypothetical protein
VYWRPLAIGLSSFVPGGERLLARKGTGGTGSARYCYEVWLKHLVLLQAHGMRALPRSLAELGPGDTLGVGLAAILCGVERYFALDVVRYSNTQANLAVFDELLELLHSRAPRSTKGWPDYDEYLDEHLFPSDILTDEILGEALAPPRVADIRAAIASGKSRRVEITYAVPWNETTQIARQSVDVVLSHAVMQSVVDLDRAYRTLYAWLRPGGYMSHQIDFTSFRTSREWNGHWTYSETLWKFIIGKRPYLINREPHSTHVRLMREHGFSIICDMQRYSPESTIPRSRLAARWQDLTADDFTCSGAFIQARRPE